MTSLSPPLPHTARARRSALAIGAVLVALTSLTACGSDESSGTTGTAATAVDESVAGTVPAPDSVPDATPETVAPDTAAGTGERADPLTFVDDRGEEVTFDEAPTRVVAWQAMVPALVDMGITPVGVIAFNDIATNPAFVDAGVNTDELVAVSTSYGEVDVEALAALEPDVILTYTFGTEFLQGFTDGSTEELAGQVAPFIALDANADVLTGIERMEEVGVLLGADLDSPENQADAADFDAAVAELTAVIEAQPGLTATFGGPSIDGLFLAPEADYPELRFYADLGLDIHSGPEDALVSWELVEDVDADVFLIDDRTTEAELDQLSGEPLWEALPAVAAGQYSPTWRFLLAYSRADYARTINRMLPTLSAADPNVV